MSSAKEHRVRFRQIAKADREAHQSFSIRVWRALSRLCDVRLSAGTRAMIDRTILAFP